MINGIAQKGLVICGKLKWPYYVLLLFLFSCNDSSVDFEGEVRRGRDEQAFFLRNDPGSPFAGQVEAVEGVSYFPADEKYRIQAHFERSVDVSRIEIPTSDGKKRPFREFGVAEFTLDGQVCRLTIYQSAEFGNMPAELFLGFTDQTTGEETYGAGRYLNVRLPTDDAILLDFNFAYNPYCAYSDKFSCPIPPRNNKLPVPVRAGEKNYKN
ncbi:MAG: DUF1684 domain-containing protein [Cyclobacteriaceae bacterium]|nr:DUF1684 domain-containing protein [Cyclobacteriaceae bacterium]